MPKYIEPFLCNKLFKRTRLLVQITRLELQLEWKKSKLYKNFRK